MLITADSRADAAIRAVIDPARIFNIVAEQLFQCNVAMLVCLSRRGQMCLDLAGDIRLAVVDLQLGGEAAIGEVGGVQC